MAICIGSLQLARDESTVQLMEYWLPGYRDPWVENPPSGVTTLNMLTRVWNATHDGSMRYLKYHPKYCSMFNKGDTLYLILGMSHDVNSNFPPEMGQWLVAYDLIGTFYEYYKLDDTPSPPVPIIPGSTARRPLLIENDKLNGLAVMGCYHDGIVSIVAEGQHYNDPLTGAQKTLKLVRTPGSGIGTLEVETQPFFTGPFRRAGDAMTVHGRNVFFLVNNRLFQGDVYMLEVFCTNDFFTTAIDMGIVASGQTVRRRVWITNRSPYYTYSNLIIEARDARVSLAIAEDDEPVPPFTDRIRIPGELPVGATTSFFAQLSAPIIHEENMVKTFYDRLSFKFQSSW